MIIDRILFHNKLFRIRKLSLQSYQFIRYGRTAPRLFKIIWVDPHDICEYSYRIPPSWNPILRTFGHIKGGRWDTIQWDNIKNDIDYWKDFLKPFGIEPSSVNSFSDISTEVNYFKRIVAGRFNETIFYQSLFKHFNDKVPWTNTEFVSKCLDDDPIQWSNCESESDVIKKCNEIDGLYKKIKNNGYKTRVQVGKNKYTKHGLDEILVDIDRDGKLLFINGRHRLAIAKILNLDIIPVRVVCRHTIWQSERTDLIKNDSATKHPDV